MVINQTQNVEVPHSTAACPPKSKRSCSPSLLSRHKDKAEDESIVVKMHKKKEPSRRHNRAGRDLRASGANSPLPQEKTGLENSEICLVSQGRSAQSWNPAPLFQLPAQGSE